MLLTIYPAVINIPVESASPIGKTNSHPKSSVRGIIGVIVNPKIKTREIVRKLD
jgi:hypothetical protein